MTIGAPKHKHKQRQRDRCIYHICKTIFRLRPDRCSAMVYDAAGKGMVKGKGLHRRRGVVPRALPWVCGPCNWRNPGAPLYCVKCGKAKQWAHNNSRRSQVREAAALDEQTAAIHAEVKRGLGRNSRSSKT